MAGLISRSLSATLKDRESPAGPVSASKGFAISRGESGREGGPLTRECGSSIGPGGSILPSIHPCLPSRDFAPPVTNIPGYACRSRFLRGSFSSSPSRLRPPIEITSVVEIAFYCRFPFDAIRNPLLHRSREEIRETIVEESRLDSRRLILGRI